MTDEDNSFLQGFIEGFTLKPFQEVRGEIVGIKSRLAAMELTSKHNTQILLTLEQGLREAIKIESARLAEMSKTDERLKAIEKFIKCDDSSVKTIQEMIDDFYMLYGKMFGIDVAYLETNVPESTSFFQWFENDRERMEEIEERLTVLRDVVADQLNSIITDGERLEARLKAVEGNGNGTRLKMEDLKPAVGIDALFDKAPLYRHVCTSKKCRHHLVNRIVSGVRCNKCGYAMESHEVVARGARGKYKPRAGAKA